MTMNNEILKRSFTLLFILCLIFAAASCDMFEMQRLKTPEGMGVLSLSIAGEGAQSTQGRAILPKPETNKSFASYKLDFFIGDSIVQSESVLDLTSVYVSAGTYKLTVTAYENSDFTNPVAQGSISSIEIIPNYVTNEIIDLYPIKSGSGSGTFSWNISFETIQWAYMEITNQAGTTAYSETYILTGSPPVTGAAKGINSSINIPAGDYRVVFKLKKDDATRIITWRESLHVYQNLESNYTYNFKDEYFALNIYEVVINYNNGTPSDEYSYFHGDLLANPGTPEKLNYSFGGWYTTSNFSAGSEWTYTEGMQVTTDLTLYAKWNAYPKLVYPENVEFSMLYGKTLPEKTITIRNDGLGEAKGINIVVADTANFELAYPQGSINTISSLSSASFIIKPKTALAIGEYNTSITISCTGETNKIINVKFTVNSRYSGTAIADKSFNSNDLITVDNPVHGWWSKTVTGNWLRGYMVTAENTNLDIQLINVPFRFNELGTYFDNTWRPLDGGVGRWKGQNAGSGSSARARVFVEIFIPYDDMEIWIESPTGGAVGATTYPETDEPSNTGWISLQQGSNDYVLRFKLESRASSEYIENFQEFSYPIFQSGAVYYWMINDQDYWNIAGEDVVILEFDPKEHNETGTIKIRAYDVSEEGVSFYPDPAGADILFPPITSANYSAPIILPLEVLGETVGSVSIRMTGHIPANNIITRVTVEVVYNLDPDFASFVESYTCNGIEAPVTNKVTLTNLNHGPLTLHTEFNFADAPAAP